MTSVDPPVPTLSRVRLAPCVSAAAAALLACWQSSRASAAVRWLARGCARLRCCARSPPLSPARQAATARCSPWGEKATTACRNACVPSQRTQQTCFAVLVFIDRRALVTTDPPTERQRAVRPAAHTRTIVRVDHHFAAAAWPSQPPCCRRAVMNDVVVRSRSAVDLPAAT